MTSPAIGAEAVIMTLTLSHFQDGVLDDNLKPHDDEDIQEESGKLGTKSANQAQKPLLKRKETSLAAIAEPF